MAKISFSNNIHARGRELYLQTNTIEEEQKIVSTLFDGGRVLAKEETFYGPELTTEELSERVEKLHSETITSIEFLYSISAKVKTVRHPLSLNTLGQQFLKWNLLDEAISEFELAIQYDGHYGKSYLNLGEAYFRRGGLKEAVEILEKGVKILPGYADIWQKLGKVYLKSNRYKEAIQAFHRALKINPSYDEAHFFMALCLIEILVLGIQQKGLPTGEECRKQAREYLGRAAALSPRFQTPEFEEAMRKFHQGRVEQALELLHKIEKQLPEVINLDFHDAFYLGLLYGERGRNTKAVEEYVSKLEELVKKHPDFPDVRNMLGIGYIIQCRNLFNKALRQFETACEINPEYDRAKTNLKLARNDGKGLLILLRAMLK